MAVGLFSSSVINFCFLACADDLSLLQLSISESRSTSRSSSSFRYSPSDPAAQTLLNVDKNRDGRIDPTEIAAFARTQGMDGVAATKEFASIDQNRDGFLDSEELQFALGTAAPMEHSAARESNAPAATSQALIADSSGFASTVTVPRDVVRAPAVADSNIASEMSIPTLNDTSDSTITSDASIPILSDASRESAMSAAQRVTEQLSLEESEEKKARELDREAADLHAKSDAFAKSIVKDAMQDGAKSANENTEEILLKVQKINAQADKAAVKAAALNAKAKLEMDEAQQLMLVANQAVKA